METDLASPRRHRGHHVDFDNAQPAPTGCASGTWSAEPMPRPDHKAKKHGRPRNWTRGLHGIKPIREQLRDAAFLFIAMAVPLVPAFVLADWLRYGV